MKSTTYVPEVLNLSVLRLQAMPECRNQGVVPPRHHRREVQSTPERSVSLRVGAFVLIQRGA